MGVGKMAIASCAAALHFTCGAALVERDLAASGDRNLTFDTTSGLEWLDLDLNAGLAPNAAQAQASGFRFATVAELSSLMQNHGLPALSYGEINFGIGENPPAPNYVALKTLAQFIGLGERDPADNDPCLTAYVQNPAARFDIFDVCVFELGVHGGLWSYNLNGAEGYQTNPPHDLTPHFRMSTFLVRNATVPEPSMLGLVLVSLAGLAAIRSRCYSRNAF